MRGRILLLLTTATLAVAVLATFRAHRDQAESKAEVVMPERSVVPTSFQTATRERQLRYPKLKLTEASNVPVHEDQPTPVSPNIDYLEYLDAKPPWKGALPSSVADLPRSLSMQAKVQEYGGPDAVTRQLQMLSNLRRCAGTKNPIRPGAILYEAKLHVDHGAGTLRASDVVLLASTLDERDDLPVLECVTAELQKAVKLPKETLDKIPGETISIRRGRLGIPIETDAMYHWLFDAETPSN